VAYVIVERAEGSLLDRLRAYTVLIDGEYRGKIKSKEKWSYSVPPGTHSICFKVGHYESPALKIMVEGRTHIFCRPGLTQALGLAGFIEPQSWISVREEDDISRDLPPTVAFKPLEPGAGPDDAASQGIAGIFAHRNLHGATRLAHGASTQAAEARALLELDLREAATTGALDIRFEPEIDLTTRHISGFEVLLRWDHPVHGAVPASIFVPMAEKLGLSATIGQYVARHALEEAATWPDDIGLSFKASLYQIRCSAFLPFLQRCLAAMQFPAQRLTLEIPETVSVEPGSADHAALESLRAAGFRIIIGDYRLESLSLQDLTSAPIDGVKLHRSVVRAMDTDLLATAKVYAVIDICNKRHLQCCAQGVETEEQLLALAQEYCPSAQGKLFSPPLAARELAPLIARINSKRTATADTSRPLNDLVAELAQTANDTIMITTSDLDEPGPQILYVNQACARLSGYAADELMGNSPRMLQGPGTSRAALDSIRTGLAAGQPVREKILNYTKGGAPYWVDLKIVPLRNDFGKITHFGLIGRDVTTGKWRLDEVDSYLRRDPVTGFENMNAITTSIESAIASYSLRGSHTAATAAPPCVLVVAIHPANGRPDSMELEFNSAAMLVLADRLAAITPRGADLGYLGSARFAVLLPDADLLIAQALAELITRAVTVHRLETAGQSWQPRCTANIAAWRPGDTAAALLNRAMKTPAMA